MRDGKPDLLDAINAFRKLIGSALFIGVGLAFLVLGSVAGRIVGVVLLSPWIYWGVRAIRQRRT